jgi:bacteriocin-like protein
MLPPSRTTAATTWEAGMTKPDVKRDANSEKRELTIDELNAVTGGDAKPCPPTSNVLKTRHDTVKNSINNVR